VPAGVVALLAMPLGLEATPLAVMDWGLSWVTATAYEVASWPGAAHATPSFSTLGLVLMTIGGLWLCLWTQSWRWGGLALIGLGMAVAPIETKPDVYVAAGGRTFAVRQADGSLAIPPLASGRFDAESWLKANGEAVTLQTAKARAKTAISCAEDMCWAQAPWGQAVYVRARETPPDCIDAAVIIAPHTDPRPCAPGALALTKGALARTGGVTLTRSGQGWTIRTVAADRGERPWTSQTPNQ
jgi:competence protein ComEC